MTCPPVRILPLVLLVAAACSGSDTAAPEPVKDPNIVGSTGGTVTASGGLASLSIPAGALSSEVKITVAAAADPVNDSRTGTGTPFEFGPEGTKFSQPVALTLKYDRTKLPAGGAQSELRVAQLTDDGWILVQDSFVIDSTSGTVKVAVSELGRSAAAARIMALSETAVPGGARRDWHSFRRRPIWTPYYPPFNPCQAVGLDGTGTQAFNGQLLAGDCVEAGNGGRRTDYYTVTTSEQTVLNVEVAGAIKGPFGLVSQGLVAYSSAQIGSTLSTLVPAGTWRLFVTGADSTTTGSYTITTSTSSLAARSGCENLAVVSGQTIAGKVDSSDCSATVPDWSPYTAFRGKTFYLDLYRAKLLAGKTYTFSTAHSGTGVNACSVLWVGGKIVASVLDKGPETNPKVMTYTSAVDQYATVEVEGCSTRGDVWSPGAVTNYALTISP